MRIRIFNESCNEKKRKFYIFPFSCLLSRICRKNSLNLIRIYRECGNFAVGNIECCFCSLWILHWFFLRTCEKKFGGKLTQEESFSTSIIFFILFEVLIKVSRKLTNFFADGKNGVAKFHAYWCSVGNVVRKAAWITRPWSESFAQNLN